MILYTGPHCILVPEAGWCAREDAADTRDACAVAVAGARRTR